MSAALSRDGAVALLRMEGARGNALSFELIDALNRAFDDVEKSDAGALVLTGKGKVFSVGLDLLACSTFDRPMMARFVDAFDDVFLRLQSLPLPTIAAVNGHAVAGGCILALACDLRFLSATMTNAQFGVHEVALGIPFPAGALGVAMHTIPAHAWGEAFLEGRKYTPGEAAARGLVTGVVDDPVAAAMERARTIAANPRVATSAVKRMLLEDAVARAATDKASTRARFLDAWFDDAARSRISALVATLRG